MIRKEFWKHYSIEKLTHEEWEAICDGCGKCCLIKLQTVKKEMPTYTSLSCQYLDTETCRCKVYSSRKIKQAECITLSPKNLNKIVEWLPNSCSYRLIYEKKDLPIWHHLKSKTVNSVHKTGNSVKNLTISELFVDEEDFVNFINNQD